eukprot:CAMPEP_0184868516 /NCGR_PEP_ID=MMETSP0580-20130426/30714_1 /TAXON_ID=1118495 /ORGANISM="Dactyliosolen fragilissimus" /LENGTH=79 /DNA_ID=CAMNT_0027369461 /DNA_START=25 /DNA_END=261 /DNA_ORIENTATION=-
MTPVLGHKWSYDEKLIDFGFDDAESLGMVASMENITKEVIIEQAKQDLSRVLPTLDENVYGFGKQVARLAQIVHVLRKL